MNAYILTDRQDRILTQAIRRLKHLGIPVELVDHPGGEDPGISSLDYYRLSGNCKQWHGLE